MSTLVTNTITGLSTAANITIGSTPVVSASANSLTIRGEGSAQTSVQQGLAKLWMNLDGSTFGIGDSLNMTSATDNGAGDYTGTIANDMANTEWALTAHSGQAVNRTESDVTVTAFEIHTFDQDGSTKGDTGRVMVAGHGDLA